MDVSLPAIDGKVDIALVRRAQNGDTSAFGQLCGRHATLVRKVCIRCLAGTGQPEDVVQDVFLEAWRKVRTYDPSRGPVRAWLVTMARCRSIDARRAAKRRPMDTPHQDGREIAQSDIPLERQVEGRRAANRLSSLSEEHRQALLLTYYAGYTISEAAEASEVPLGTMKARVHRAVAQLRNQLVEDSGHDL